MSYSGRMAVEEDQDEAVAGACKIYLFVYKSQDKRWRLVFSSFTMAGLPLA